MPINCVLSAHACSVLWNLSDHAPKAFHSALRMVIQKYCSARGGHILYYTCCTDTHDWDQSEIKRSSCEIRNDQVIKTSVFCAQSRSRWVLSFDSTHTPPTFGWQSRVKALLAVRDQQSRSKNGPNQILIVVTGVSMAGYV